MKRIYLLLGWLGFRRWKTTHSYTAPHYSYGSTNAQIIHYRHQVCLFSGKIRRQTRNGYGWKTDKSFDLKRHG